MRLLPLPGADLAAGWASTRMDGLGDDPAALEDLRDRLVAWVRRPARAKRLFAAAQPAPARGRKAPSRGTSDRPASSSPLAEPARRGEAPSAAVAAAAPDPVAATAVAPAPAAPAPARDPESSDVQPLPVQPRPQVTQVVLPAPEPTADEQAAVPSGEEAVPAPDRDEQGALPRRDPEAVPAWQRTRSGGRLQQERAGRQDEPAEEDEQAPQTAPVLLQHAHRAAGAPSADTDDVVREEAHQQARHARDGEVPTRAEPSEAGEDAAEDRPAVRPAPARRPAPAWLDTYDDEAQVTQNLDLKTPPPVSASSVRDRGSRGEDLVPRT